MTPSLPRFFVLTGLHPPYALLMLGAIVGVGGWTTSVSPGELDSGLAMLLFSQMFLASSGFLVRARRGHFDPLLLGGGDRTRVLVWHWLVSIAPGVAAWICLAGAGYVLGSPAAISALVGQRGVALFIVSSLAWAAGFMLTRGAAGVVWMAVLLGLLVRRVDVLAPSAFAAGESVLRQAALLMLCPFVLVGNHLAVASAVVWVAALSSAVLLLSVWRLSGGLDIYLVDRA
jgi:hypothetical protein